MLVEINKLMSKINNVKKPRNIISGYIILWVVQRLKYKFSQKKRLNFDFFFRSMNSNNFLEKRLDHLSKNTKILNFYRLI